MKLTNIYYERELRLRADTGIINMNCLCDLFDNECLWIIIIAVLILSWSNCGNCGCNRNYDRCGCDRCN